MQNGPQNRSDDESPTSTARVRTARRAAYAALALESAWPTLFRGLCLVSLFFTLTWFGLFERAPHLLRLAALVGFVAAAGWIAWRARNVRLPTHDAVNARIEAASRLPHRPLRTQDDRATAGGDAFAAALWREHQRRMAASLKRVVPGRPRTATERLDPYGLRAVLALLLVTAFAYSAGSGGGGLGDAFAGPEGEAQVAARVDAWVTPPGYTGRAPIYLNAQGDGSGPVEVPAGSVLSVRVSDGSDAALSFAPDGHSPQPVARSASSEPAAAAAAPAANGASYEFPLRDNGRALLATAFSTLGDWRFQVIPDLAPTIAFAGEPMRGRSGALELAYKVLDDYGAGQGKATLQLRDPPAATARPLFPAPEIKLAMPRRTKGEATGRTASDLTENPYAGATMRLALSATDDAGQTGRSETRTIVLPERRFANPAARAVIEQRRLLALDANAAPKVVEMLDAVSLRAMDYGLAASSFVALQAVRSRIDNAANDETLVSAVDFLWRIALGIEDGNLSEAEKRVKDAQDALSQALENGAPDAEIDKLMAELRQAMQDYMQQLAEQMRNQPPLSQEQLQSGNMQEIRPQDLDRMMDRIENLAKSGSKDAARQLLAEMQEMMQSLQAARPMQGQQQGGQQNPMQQQMDQLGELLRQQQALRDETFDLNRRRAQEEQGMGAEPRQPGEDGGEPQQGQNGEGGQPMSPEEMQRRLSELEKRQGELQKQLGELQEAMRGMGMEPGEGFGDAGEAMGRAQGALGQGNEGEATERQGEAMEALRRGARDMMQQMQQAMGQGQGQGEGQDGRQGQREGGYGRGEQRSDRDPLGRPRATEGPDFGQDTDVPDEIDTQRARRILEAIRNRLGDQLSPQQEREYLERLLRTP